MIRLALMVAVAENEVIGRDNGLPWHLPEDLRYFRRITMGKPIVMGRKTFESIGRPLPGRTNIVVSRNSTFTPPDVSTVTSVEEALAMARRVAAVDGQDEAVIIGGAQIYKLALPQVDRLYITRVHASVAGDTWLPAIDWSRWRETSRECHGASGDNPYAYSFVVYDRVGLPANTE